MEQDAEGLLWSSYRTIGAGWPDFYALLREPREADAEALRLSINALYAHAGANRDHRDLRRRFYFQMLQEKVLPEARRVLLDEAARRAYDEQWSLHADNLPGAISYERFLSELPSSRQASSQLDAQIAQELTDRLEAQLAAQREAQDRSPNNEMTPDEMGALPVSSLQDAPLNSSLAGAATARVPQPEPQHESSDEEDEPGRASPPEEPEPPLDLQVLAVKEPPPQALADSQDEAPDARRLRGGGRLLQGHALRPPATDASQEADQPGSASAATVASGARAAQGAASISRIVVGLSNEEMRAIGRRSQRRWMRRSAIRLSLGGLAAALLGAGTAWALLRGTTGAAQDEAEVRLQASVENAISRAIARSEQAQPQLSAQPQAPVTAGAMASTASTSGVSTVAANVPRMRLDTLLQNADFEGLPSCNDGDLKPWQVWPGTRNTGVGSAFAVGASKEQDARSGRWRLVFWKNTPFEASVFQVVKNLRPGLYQLNAWTKRSGGQEWAGIVVADYGGPRIHYLVPASTRWTPVTVRDIRVTNGQCKIGFYTRSLLGKKWLAVDAVEFHPQS